MRNQIAKVFATAALVFFAHPASAQALNVQMPVGSQCPAGYHWEMSTGFAQCVVDAPPVPITPPDEGAPPANTVGFVLVPGGLFYGGSVSVPAGYRYALYYTSAQGSGGATVEYVMFLNVPADKFMAAIPGPSQPGAFAGARNPGSSATVNGWTVVHGTPSIAYPLVSGGGGFTSYFSGGGSNGPGTCFTWSYLESYRVCNSGSTVQ